MNMSKGWAKRFAHRIDNVVIVALFESLKKQLGDNHSKACSEIGITRKSPYDWDSIPEIKTTTKQKILENLFSKYPLETFGQLSLYQQNLVVDILMTSLMTINQRIVESNDKQQLIISLELFDKTINQFKGVIYRKCENEIDDMVYEIQNYIDKKGLSYKFENYHLYDQTSLESEIMRRQYAVTNNQSTQSGSLTSVVSNSFSARTLSDQQLPPIRTSGATSSQ